MKQVFIPYWKWEDYKCGMWRKETKTYEQDNLASIIAFTGNHIEYGKAMITVIDNWKFSCLHNLTNKSINRKAWIGHAACCIKHRYPEYLVREAWKYLTDNQRSLANQQAELAISLWEQRTKLSNTLSIGKTDATNQEYQMKLQLTFSH